MVNFPTQFCYNIIMKIYKITAQEKPWYGSACWERNIEARNEASAISKAKKMFPDVVWIWVDGEVKYVNQKVLDRFQAANPGVVFYHF